ncbi:MAG: lysylphosphatidylglycerol synthase domain-containing protein [Gaiellaceae bacterium]
MDDHDSSTVTRLRALGASRWARPLGTLLGLGLLAVLLLRLAHLWDEHPVPLGDANWGLLALALLLSGLAMAAYAAVWGTTIRATGVEAPPGLLVAFFAGQLGKYVPGSAWQYVGRAGLATRLGVPVRCAAVSLGLEALCSLAAAALAAPFILADSTARALAVTVAIAAAGAAAVALIRSPWGSRIARRVLEWVAGRATVSLRSLEAATPRYFAVWLVFGAAFWLTARGLFDVPVSDLLVYTGAYAAAWAVGFLVVVAPGGLGVREAVLVALLRGRLGESEAIVLASASRIAFTLVDLVGGATALTLLRVSSIRARGRDTAADSRSR